MDPLFNLREIAKQLLLLEDHLGHLDKRCSDCIRKHLLTVEALADEAVALDPTGIYAHGCGLTVGICKGWAEKLIDGADPAAVCQEVRQFRKKLTPMVFDPRGAHGRERLACVTRSRSAHP